MSYQLRNTAGAVEAVIDDNCGMKKFYSIANTLSKELRIKFTGKQDNFDTTDWDFSYKGHLLKLQQLFTSLNIKLNICRTSYQ